MRPLPSRERPAAAARHIRVKRSLVLLTAAVALLVGGCGQDSDTRARPETGLRGHARVDGGCPVVEAGESCPARPLSAVVVVTRSGEESAYAEVTSEADGSYELRLPPGEYDVSGRGGDDGTPPFLKPVHVTVAADGLTTLDLMFDSGVR